MCMLLSHRNSHVVIGCIEQVQMKNDQLQEGLTALPSEKERPLEDF